MGLEKYIKNDTININLGSGDTRRKRVISTREVNSFYRSFFLAADDKEDARNTIRRHEKLNMGDVHSKLGLSFATE